MRTADHPTLIHALAAAPSGRAFVTMWNSEDDSQCVTFGEFRRWAQAQAASFAAHGLQAGDRVILIMPQGIPLMTAFAGAMLLGAVPAILAYPNFKVEPSKYRFGLSGVSANLRARMVVIDDGFPADLLSHVTIGNGTELVRGVGLPAPGAPFDDVISRNPCAPDDIAFIQHSAGTTGLQKGVALSHAAVLRQLGHLTPVLRLGVEDRIYSWLPLYHDMGLIACFVLPMVCHIPVVMQSPIDWVMQPGAMVRLMSEHRCTLAWLPNFAFQFLARRVRPADRAGVDLSSIRMLINCSEPVRAESMDEFMAAYAGCNLRPDVCQSSYAAAETVFAITQSGTPHQPVPARAWVDGHRLRQDHLAFPVAADSPRAVCFVSSGQCLPGTQVCIVDGKGSSLPDGSVGELLIRSDSLFDGYYNRPDLTAEAIRDGWYLSGDLGFTLSCEVYVVGRKKDLIIVGGKNIYPQDVENIVFSHPLIHDGRAVAFGMYNPELGTEDIVAVAEVNDAADLPEAAAIERQIRAAVTAELGVAVRAVYVKHPRWIVKSTAGKPARSTTRQKLLKEHPELSSAQFGLGAAPDAPSGGNGEA